MNRDLSSNKPVLVTGAAGLVGRQLVRRLSEQGRSVLAVDRFSSVTEEGIEIQECDLGDVHGLHAIAQHGIDSVVHCGAYSGPMVARDAPYSMVQVNIVGTANMLELARIHNARRFVYCSSTSAYGVTKSSPVMEDSALRPASLYGASKVASEYITTAYANQYGLSAASIRLSWVYGPGRTTPCVIRTMIEDALANRPTRLPFGSDFPRQFIHVDDAVDGLVSALDAPTLPRATYNITGDTRTTLEQVAALVRAVFKDADIELQPGPDPVDELQEKFSIEAARRDLAYEPRVALEQGIRAYANWITMAQSKESDDPKTAG
ncbi:NAD-dependent dehydratase [Stutzerimonas stutzeri]|jgi:nucleoside-diphosphate-sugar epimerase|uniref:NAD(P)-dependent oxidoreductase n=2 Tax=Pseudomonadaceae TaxID=135621 RepID=A0ABX8J1P2_9GAMM|nr:MULTISPECIES: NAD(P)-dependent oxidoreductase [Pseudomonadaceae]MBU1459364.1 NAD(P)-dependent oxidoreductase [Gammaproteobacteria bacterium]MBU2339608.1 NAD(P)-dependent oxidoreductase [Alphaproteobacteria bacterium]MBC8650487.1 NAD(P)-dependent oxidoreductase [Pseudomonas sp. MT4]MBU2391625.1 NAD(P)-dependent oxidoreductase [Alphaproteobacteria bacterium]OPG84105.1 NAD-dependent dehydratase [Stutzerimonas stutzeri]|tara:strand:+ start:51 stop:1010 length:960 start_codon:yes stop_codon:yes gene_type:complete